MTAAPPVHDAAPVHDTAPAPRGDPRRRPALSPSRAADFRRCPLLYRFRAIDRLPEEPSPAALRGTVVHAVLERLFALPAARRDPAHARVLAAEVLAGLEPDLRALLAAALPGMAGTPVRARAALPGESASVSEPFYRILGGADDEVLRVEATASTAGPWFSDAQHMGPPSALLVRALERHGGRAADAPPVRLARLTVEVLGKVPLGEMEVETVVERAGRTIELLGAELRAGGRAVARAHGWRHAVADVADAATDQGQAMPPPEQGEEHPRPPGWLPGYLDALEWRWLSGALEVSGPGRVWARLRVPVVVDADGVAEEPSGWQRLAAVADSTNGAGARQDASRWLFLNTDLTLHVHRAPAGVWIGLDADSVLGPDGAGTAFSVLHDGDGPVGRAAQALTVRPR